MNGARNSPNAPFESENDPLDTGLARVPDSPAVTVTVPPTPAVSRSSSAYTPTSGKPSSWRWASARPRVGRAPWSTSLPVPYALWRRSEEHTSELQSPVHLVCRLLLEKKNRRDRDQSEDLPLAVPPRQDLLR